MNDKMVQVAVFAISVVGYVALALKDQATAEYVALVGPVLGAAFLMSHLKQQDRVLGEIHENTNGVLDARIKAAVRAAQQDVSGTE
ncbi:hypothetical protein [Streptomyces halobius]|uniref:Holin n=1 Tax=Streptomyces halobius TaxID=2879846 RepID=A0ABY4M1J4_9ACTN|nr:hypothetical protein [Streptomyces halobius]UQA91625.1 hypothetical protein K9S39_06920 [Streptomyces halobius]